MSESKMSAKLARYVNVEFPAHLRTTFVAGLRNGMASRLCEIVEAPEHDVELFEFALAMESLSEELLSLLDPPKS
jgi:hypothetical protein